MRILRFVPALAVAVLTLGLAGCSSEPGPGDERTFLAMWHTGDSRSMTGPRWTDEQLLALGRVACEQLPTGEATAVRAVQGASRAYGEQMPDLSAVPLVNFAGDHLCV